MNKSRRVLNVINRSFDDVVLDTYYRFQIPVTTGGFELQTSYIYQMLKHIDIYTARKVSIFGNFWSVFSHILTEYGEILGIFTYSVRMQENTD